MACRQDKETLVTVRLEGTTIGSGLTLALNDTVRRAVWDSTHSAIFCLDGDIGAGYADLGYERAGTFVYIEPENLLT